MTGSSLKGKTAVVTGGASGIGRAIANRFAASGARVWILDLDASQGEAAAAEIRARGSEADAAGCDVGDAAQVSAAFHQIFQRGPLHILVNSAGIAHIGTLESTSPADLERVMRINVVGMYNCMQTCMGHMKENHGGIILNMASVAAMAGLKDRFAYSTSKGAVIAMTYSVARDYLPFNIRCNCISPARIHTPFVDGFLAKNYPGREPEMFEKLSRAQPVGRMGKTDEVAALALFLCSEDASFITGVNYPMDGGFVNLRD
jgi:NAD(P)-dependent dehydrogenase (short-subunit alcohol dehydrogenase family)